MSSVKYKVGDEVRVVRSNDGDCMRLGCVGNIIEVDEYAALDDWPYYVKFSDGRCWFDEDELELVESASTTPPQGFAVGDRVRFNSEGKRLLASYGKAVNEYRLVEGTITGSVTLFSQRWCVELDDGDLNIAGGWAVTEDIIELIDDSPATSIPPHLVELARIGDDRPAPNSDEFAKSMLAFFTTDDADAMLAWAKANRRNVDMAIDVGCFALNVKRARQSDAA